jgi:hypothetical protein
MAATGWSERVLRLLVLALVVIVAYLAGILTERLRFDRARSDMLRRYDRALREHQDQIIRAEKRAGEATSAPRR